ncbi:MAG: PaaI family thioesterase [Alphaproteobacteria bacterium]|nr:PaaI family thioesterase [Alphaproteobacteria bacterium]
MLKTVMSAQDIEAFWAETFPQVGMHGRHYIVEETGPGRARMRLDAGEQHLRPGGTISGPSMFTLADLAGYAALIAHIGPVALAVTTNLNINFMRKPQPGALLCEARILKLGKSLAVVECAMFSPGAPDELVAQSTATYAIPPKR